MEEEAPDPCVKEDGCVGGVEPSSCSLAPPPPALMPLLPADAAGMAALLTPMPAAAVAVLLALLVLFAMPIAVAVVAEVAVGVAAAVEGVVEVAGAGGTMERGTGSVGV